MKSVLVLLVTALVLLAGCKPDKPWSPDDDPGLNPDDTTSTGVVSPVTEVTNIGDVEQGLWIEGRLAPETLPPGTINDEVESRRGRLAIVNVTLPRPVPEQLNALYIVKLSRNFDETPVVLRARIMVNDTPVGTIQGVFGEQARKNNVQVTVDLLSPFEQVPESFLATVEGDLYLLPPGTDETTVDPATATSDATSKAVQFNPIRVNLAPGAADAPSAPSDEGAIPAAPDSGVPSDGSPAAAPDESDVPEAESEPAPESSSDPDSAPAP